MSSKGNDKPEYIKLVKLSENVKSNVKSNV